MNLLNNKILIDFNREFIYTIQNDTNHYIILKKLKKTL